MRNRTFLFVTCRELAKSISTCDPCIEKGEILVGERFESALKALMLWYVIHVQAELQIIVSIVLGPRNIGGSSFIELEQEDGSSKFMKIAETLNLFPELSRLGIDRLNSTYASSTADRKSRTTFGNVFMNPKSRFSLANIPTTNPVLSK